MREKREQTSTKCLVQCMIVCASVEFLPCAGDSPIMKPVQRITPSLPSPLAALLATIRPAARCAPAPVGTPASARRGNPWSTSRPTSASPRRSSPRRSGLLGRASWRWDEPASRRHVPLIGVGRGDDAFISVVEDGAVSRDRRVLCEAEGRGEHRDVRGDGDGDGERKRGRRATPPTLRGPSCRRNLHPVPSSSKSASLTARSAR